MARAANKKTSLAIATTVKAVVNNMAGEGPRRPVTGFFSSGVKSVAESGVVFLVLTIVNF
jgi:hypothetical protein